jgi:RNA polymerase sigma-70 factor (ECF subfamily)
VTKPEFVELSSMESDAAIVKRVLSGDVEAFALLVDRHHPSCCRAAANILGSEDDGEDAVQEAFVRAYRHLGSYREQDRFGAWLMRIVVNQCRTRAASNQRYTSIDAVESSANLHALHGLPDEELLLSERRTELMAALSQIDEAQREAIVLRFGEELSYDEMSAITGVGASALKMRVQRACARLRAMLSERLHA